MSATPSKKRSASKTKTSKARRLYHPAKDFEGALADLVTLFKARGWSFTGVDIVLLTQDVADQRAERAELAALEQRYVNAWKSFGVNQEQRYLRYAAALSAARGAFQRDPTVMEVLERFKRATGPAKK